MIDCTYIELNELILYPSIDYVARLDGIMDFQKDVSESELFYDGAFYGSSKITSRDLTLSVIIKHQFNVNENKAEKQLNFFQIQKIRRSRLLRICFFYSMTAVAAGRIST